MDSSTVFESLGFATHYSQLPVELLESTKKLCTDGLLKSSEANAKLELPDLMWGKYFTEKVDRLSGLRYRLTVTERHAETGFLIYTESATKDRFKVIVFDDTGAIIAEDECLKSRDGKSTQSTLYFNSLNTYRLGKHTEDKATLPEFTKLINFIPSNHTITPGKYLVMVFGDNYVGKSNFRIIPVPLKTTPELIESVKTNDEIVLKLTEEISEVQKEYIAAKLAYEASIEKAKAVGIKVEQQLDVRDASYKHVLDSSLHSCDIDKNAIYSPVRKYTSVSFNFKDYY